MARQVVVQVSCDVCEASEASEIEFSVDRSTFEIDLCPQHRTEFTNALAPFVSRARAAVRTRSTSAAAPASARRGGTRRDPSQTEAIRNWARDNGYAISTRGRIPGHIEEAYNNRAR